MALQQLSPEQRRAALKKAAEVRQKRAALRADLKAGNTNLKTVLGNAADPVVARMKVSALLQSLPGVGKARSMKIMEDLKISTSRRVQGLGAKQKERLLMEVGK